MRTIFRLSDVVQPAPIEKWVYKKEIDSLQERAKLISHYADKKKHNIILVFEGWDAAGKGGAIRRLTSLFDPRLYSVISIAAPNPEERNHHYLWRFWTQLPKKGRIAIFDRSWYGRVLVERVEKFASEEDWKRAYDEIVLFEEELSSDDCTVIKFWLHITSEEQLERFNARKDDPLKRWKLTDEDWRNRDKWGLYEEACEEMILRTHTEDSPWIVVPANEKYHARINVLKSFCEVMEKRLGMPDKFK